MIAVPLLLMDAVLAQNPQNAIIDFLGAVSANPETTGSLILLMFGVLVADAVTVHHLVTERFRRSTFVADYRSVPSTWERTVRGLGQGAFQAALGRVATAVYENTAQNDNRADVIVHRGASPFVGAGRTQEPEIIALPLEPAEGASEQPARISVVDLHQHVAETLATLRSASSLTPGKRLEGLRDREQVLVPAGRLATNHRTLPGVLIDLDLPPAQHLPLTIARELAERPLEWARYYRCYRIETWDRDLTTSCYFYAGTDQRMLYLEWTHCALPPIKEHYRAIDDVTKIGDGPLSASVGALLLLPTTILRRLRSVTRRFVPLKQRVGEVVPERYGAGRSLRELAADDKVQTYFQGVDEIRYVKIVDTALFRAVGQYLEQRGYDVVEFQKIAKATITNNNVLVSGGTFIGSTMGAGTVTGGGTTQTGPAKGSE